MKKSLIISLLLSILFLGCKKEDIRISTQMYRDFLDIIQLDCPEGSSEYFQRGLMNGEEFCFLEGYGIVKPQFIYYNSITTSSPTIGVNSQGEPIKAAQRFVDFGVFDNIFGDTLKRSLAIRTPKFPHETTEVEIADWVFIKGKRWRVAEEEFQDEHLGINFFVRDNREGFNTFYEIKTDWGPQGNSFVRIVDVQRFENFEEVVYIVDIEFEADLYVNPEHSDLGLWGELREGVMHAEFILKK